MKTFALAALILAAGPAAAEGFHADFEVDPTAYALRGHSLHVGLGWDRLRLDLGAYAMALPQALHGNEDFDVSFDGFGAKLQYFPFAEQEGAFFGVDGGVTRPLVQRVGTDLAERQTQVGVGVNLGWRLLLGERFFATPWLGLGYTFGADDVTLAGSTFEAMPFTVFPAVHLGYRFL